MRAGTENNRLKAADRILGHAGIIIKTVHHHEISIDDNRDEDQIMAAVLEQMKELGLDAKVIEGTLAPFKEPLAPEDDARTNVSGMRPEGMNQGRNPKQKLIPGKDRPGYKPPRRPGKIKKEAPITDIDFDDIDENEGLFDSRDPILDIEFASGGLVVDV